MFNPSNNQLLFSVVKSSEYNNSGHSVIIAFGGEELEFSLRFFEKTSAGNRSRASEDGETAMEGMFRELDDFCKVYLNASDRKEVFEVYRDAYTAIANDDQAGVQAAVARLFTYFRLARTHTWVVNSGIRASASISEHFQQNDENAAHYRQRTYIVADYLWLAALALSLRAMVPIWGEWFQRNSSIANQWKEYAAFGLLADSSLMHEGADGEPDILPPMQKLELFVRANIPDNEDTDLLCIVFGISTEDRPYWMLAMTVIRRIAVGDIGVDPNANPPRNVCLVASSYQYISNKFNGLDKSLGGRINDKKPDSSKGDENNLSRLEGYRDPEEHQAIDRVRPNVWLRNREWITDAFMRYSDPDVERTWTLQDLREATEECYHSYADKYARMNFEPVQRKILTWMMSLVISPCMMDHIRKEGLLNLASIQAFLCFHGHSEIGGLLTAVPAGQGGDDEYVMGPATSSSRLDAATAARLRECYKHARVATSGSRNNTTYASLSKASSTPIDTCINETTSAIKACSWTMLMPAHLCNFNLQSGRLWLPPADTRLLLAKLAIAIAERKF